MATIFTTSIAPCWPPVASAVAAMVVSLGLGATAAQALTPAETALIALGKNAFFDDKLSHPSHKQACASCHDAARGWILPNSKINETTVVAPGAAPHALGSIKAPSNAYASFSPPFAAVIGGGPFAPPFRGGNFWDGRAEGCGAATGPCPVGTGAAGGGTIRPSDLPNADFVKYLGPTADQALNPFPNTVEQNIREKNVCQVVKTAKYKQLFGEAFGEDIDCSPNPKSNPGYRTSFKRVAVALAAWQSSDEVNSFSSKRDKALAADDNGHFPLVGFEPEENLGHDLFYGKARCVACHNGVPPPDPADPAGEGKHQLYTDNAFHNIGVPFNRDIPGVLIRQKVGLSSHVPAFHAPGTANDVSGFFKTPTLRNVAKGLGGGFVKAYTHGGYFKSLEGIVHFYNTRDRQPDGVTPTPRCDQSPISIRDATEAEALARGCWPPSEFPNQAGGVIGNLRLTPAEEKAIVAYLRTLADQDTPTPP